MLCGFILGATLVTLFYLFLSHRFLCRVGWHRWSPWEVDRSGSGQFRCCEKCGRHDAEPFRGFMLTKVPAATPKPPCADCLDTGFKLTDGKAERCVHEAQTSAASPATCEAAGGRGGR